MCLFSRLYDLGVFVVPAFLDDATCGRLRAAMDSGRAASAEVYVDGYVVDERVRRAFDVDVDPAIVDEVERALDAVRGDVSRFFDTALTTMEGPGFLRYPPGGFYRAHRDRLDAEREEGLPRRVSAVLFLTCCEGGALRLHGVDAAGQPIIADIPPAAGTLVAFRSDVLHEVLPVIAGVRDAIVDWFY